MAPSTAVTDDVLQSSGQHKLGKENTRTKSVIGISGMGGMRSGMGGIGMLKVQRLIWLLPLVVSCQKDRFPVVTMCKDLAAKGAISNCHADNAPEAVSYAQDAASFAIGEYGGRMLMFKDAADYESAKTLYTSPAVAFMGGRIETLPKRRVIFILPAEATPGQIAALRAAL